MNYKQARSSLIGVAILTIFVGQVINKSQLSHLDERINTCKDQMEQIQLESTALKAEMAKYGFFDEVEEVPVSVKPEEPEKEYIGTFTVTAYCPCEKCCGKWSNPENPKTATGTVAKEGRTVGADFDTIAAGTEIVIDGVGIRVVEDKPAKWIVDKYDGKILDLYFDTHSEAVKFGKKVVKVWR